MENNYYFFQIKTEWKPSKVGWKKNTEPWRLSDLSTVADSPWGGDFAVANLPLRPVITYLSFSSSEIVRRRWAGIRLI